VDIISPVREWRLENARWLFFVRVEPTYAPTGLCWFWRAVASTGVSWEGDQTFATRLLCEANATMHGYPYTPAPTPPQTSAPAGREVASGIARFHPDE
jgi:hypothetical protein